MPRPPQESGVTSLSRHMQPPWDVSPFQYSSSFLEWFFLLRIVLPSQNGCRGAPYAPFPERVPVLPRFNSQQRVETLGSVSVGHSLTIPSCKTSTSPMLEDRMVLALYGM